MVVGYTVKHATMLAAIRDDIRARLHDYQQGANLLRTRYSVERLQKDALTEWQHSKDNPTQVLAWQAIASLHAKAFALARGGRKKRDRDEKLAYQKLAAPPKSDQWTPAKCARCAVLGLVDKLKTNQDSTIAQAVLILAVRLWDADLDDAEPPFDMFGKWGMTPDGDRESLSRYVARDILGDQLLFERWMETVETAWVAMPKSPKSVPHDGEPDGRGAGVAVKGSVKTKCRGRRGKPKLSVAMSRERRELIAKFKKSRKSKKDFCNGNAIELHRLNTALAWHRIRTRRSANKMPSRAM